MTDRVYNIIKEKKKYYFINKKDYVINGYSDFLFYSKRGKLITSPNFNGELMLLVDKYNETAVHKIGHISAHVLRHTGCTRYAEKGIDLKVLHYLMGHSTTQITNDVYNHVSVKRATINIKDVEVMWVTIYILYESLHYFRNYVNHVLHHFYTIWPWRYKVF